MNPAARLSSWPGSSVLVATMVLAGQIRAAQTTPQSADYLVHVWGAEDGLSQSSVNCLAQTPDGYLWIGTRSGGLARFDGARFVTFNPQSTPALRDVEFETLSVDSRGALWITAGNESVASLADGKFRLIRERTADPRWHPLQIVAEESNAVYLASFHPAVFRVPRNGAVNEAQRVDLNPPPPNPAPGVFLQAGDGALWYITDNHQVARLPLPMVGSGKTTVFSLPSPARVLSKDSAGAFWLATDKELGVMTSDGFTDHTPTNGPAPHGVRQLIAARDGSLWMWDDAGLRKMSNGQWTLSARQFLPTPSSQTLKFFASSDGGIWVIEYGTGLWHVRADGSATLLTPENGLPSKFLTCWLEDQEGNIWIGTKEAGLARIRRCQFKEFTAADGIPGDVVQSVCEDAQGTIWVGTATGGLARKAGDKFVAVPLTANPDPLIESVTVCPDITRGIWIGTLQGSIFRCENNAVRCVDNEVTWSFPMERLRDHVANALMQDSQGRVWFGNGAGAYYFQNGKLTVFDRACGFEENIGVRALAEGPAGTLWFGTEPGDLWQVVKNVSTRYHPPAEWPNARVSALLPDADGGLWVGTLGGGLLRFENGKFTRITAQQGLPDNSITQLLEDDAGNLWGGSYAGIFRAASKDLKALAAGTADDIAFSVYGRYDGLPAQAYSGWFQPSCWRSHDGRLWFTTVKGIVSVKPGDVKVNRRAPPVVIEEMRVDGEPHEFKALANNETSAADNPTLRIAPGRHYVEFRFTGINFTAPDKVRFKWRLDNAENGWRESVSQRSAGYGPLPPGEYTFRVLAANSDGIWNETGASIAFSVLPFIWQTLWFRTAFGGGVCLGLVLLATFAQHRRHRLELERLEHRNEIERERTRIAQDLHDDLGTGLTQISLLSSVLDQESATAGATQGLTQQIRSTSRTMVTALNEIVWAVNPKNDSLGELAGYLGNFAEAFFRAGPIRCRLDIPGDLPERPLPPEVRHGLFLAFKEAINNVARHSHATEVRVRVRCLGDELQLAVEDNGIGFDPGAPGGGNGLANMRQRLEKLGGSCDLRTAAGAATTVVFRLNLGPRP